ncbi:hypothetical protein Dimus_011908 [Dionaea muscipula]
MATTKLYRLRPSHVSLSFLLSRLNPSFQWPPSYPPSPSLPPPQCSPNFHHAFYSSWLGAASLRRFSSRGLEPELLPSSHTMNSRTVSELEILGYNDGLQTAGGAVALDGAWFDESFLPVRVLIYFLDRFHDLTGLPWWIIIVSSTLALRVTLLPLIILQLHKLIKIAQLFPKLPPPFPPPFSGRSVIDQFSHFRSEKKAIGCPSYLWFWASFCVQVPCFLLGMTSIRRMSLEHHPGFDIGGILWFQNLADYPHGGLGPIIPALIAGLHLFNVQISFRSSTVGKDTGMFSLLARAYKFYLDVLTIPIFYIGLFCVPQGSLVYWITNSSLNVIQQLAFQHSAIREILGLPNKNASAEAPHPEMALAGPKLSAPPNSKPIVVDDLSPVELVNLSVISLAQGNQDGALPLLRRALDKDREYVRAMILMGQAMLQKGWEVEAIKVLEHAISKLLSSPQISDEGLDHLILASTWAGSACSRQGKMDEALAHLKRVALMPEPEDSKSKGHYYDGLLLYSSALAAVGYRDEAIRYMRAVVAYAPKYNTFLEQLLKDEEGFVDDLVDSRRTDR